MPEIQAFRGLRYDLGHVGSLSDVVAPPYDVIDPALQQALYARSPYNVIRLILNKEEPTDGDNDGMPDSWERAVGTNPSAGVKVGVGLLAGWLCA